MGTDKNIVYWQDRKKQRLESETANFEPFSVISCYDYISAFLAQKAGIDMILVGDSAAEMVLGLPNTLGISMDFMIEITRAVKRGAPQTFIIGDMPFMSYQSCKMDAIKNASRFITEAGVDIVKVEINKSQLDVIKWLNDTEIPVMAHVGLRPQSVAKTGTLKAKGMTAKSGFSLIKLTEQAIEAGADMILVEGCARQVGSLIAKRVEVPVISCGSGPDCDGQVLVITDILGMSEGFKPKFSHHFAKLGEQVVKAFEQYAGQIKSGSFPDDEHCYHMKEGQLEELEVMLREELY